MTIALFPAENEFTEEMYSQKFKVKNYKTLVLSPLYPDVAKKALLDIEAPFEEQVVAFRESVVHFIEKEGLTHQKAYIPMSRAKCLLWPVFVTVTDTSDRDATLAFVGNQYD